MKRALWRLRLILWIVGFGFLTWFLIAYTPWHTLFPPKYDKYAEEGGPMVKAIYAYRNERGMFPQFEDELAPKYIDKLPAGWWIAYERGWPQVMRKVRNEVWVGYDFDPAERKWRAWGQFVDQTLKVSQEVPPEPTWSEEERARRILAEYDRRIRSMSDLPENWQGKGAFLHEIGRTDELAAFLNKAQEHRPMFFWPRLAKAVLEWELAQKAKRPESIGDPFRFLPKKAVAATASAPATASATATAPASGPATAVASAPATTTAPAEPSTEGERFVSWMAGHPTFTNYFYVYAYARTVGNEAAALRAAELAMGEKVETSAEDPKPRYYHLYRLARFAYDAKQYDLCLQICTEWANIDQQDRTAKRKGNRSYLPLAAAANLAIGDFDRADSLAERAIIADDHRPRLWAQNLDPLKRATARKDRGYVYVADPAGKEKEYDVFERGER